MSVSSATFRGLECFSSLVAVGKWRVYLVVWTVGAIVSLMNISTFLMVVEGGLYRSITHTTETGRLDLRDPIGVLEWKLEGSYLNRIRNNPSDPIPGETPNQRTRCG